MEKGKNYAFIDAQNLHQSSKNWGWKLDYSKLRKFLKDEHGVEVAYLFMGYMPQYSETYLNLQKAGFVIVFREAMEHNGQVYKANCDTDLVLQVMVDFDEYDKAVIVSGDGDYISLMNHLVSRNKLEVLLAPNKSAYSIPLKKAAKNNIRYLNIMRSGLVDDEFEKNHIKIKQKKKVGEDKPENLSKKLITKHLKNTTTRAVKPKKQDDAITISFDDDKVDKVKEKPKVGKSVLKIAKEVDDLNTNKVDQSIKDLFKIDSSSEDKNAPRKTKKVSDSTKTTKKVTVKKTPTVEKPVEKKPLKKSAKTTAKKVNSAEKKPASKTATKIKSSKKKEISVKESDDNSVKISLD